MPNAPLGGLPWPQVSIAGRLGLGAFLVIAPTSGNPWLVGASLLLISSPPASDIFLGYSAIGKMSSTFVLFAD